MAPLIAGILKTLVANNLPNVAQAVLTQGKEFVEAKTGVKLTENIAPEDVQALNDHEHRMAELHNDNTADARAMQAAALAQDDKFSKRFVYYFAAFWSFAAAVYIGFITFAAIPTANVRFADTILGFILGTVIATIMNFYFGSSEGSKKKDIKP